MKSTARFVMSSSIVTIRSLVSGPVSVHTCLPTLPNRGSIGRVVLIRSFAVHHASGAELGEKCRVFWIVWQLRFLLRVQVVEVAVKLIKAVHSGQELIAVAEMVLAELAGRIAERLEQFGNRGVFLLKPERRPRQADLRQARAQTGLAGNERGPPGGAALLGIVVGKHHAFLRHAVDVGRLVAHQPVRIGADIRLPNVITPNNDDVGLSCLRVCQTRQRYLYVASLAPHAPYQAPKEAVDAYKGTIGDEKRRTYAAMITELDTQVGRIVAALKQKNMLDNTLIIFSSDNGGATSALFATGARSPEEREESGGVELGAKPPASNGDLRGGKGSLHEGGVRVPTIFYWPAKLKPRVVEEPLHMVDVMPTVLALAGAAGSPDHPFDGKDIWPSVAEARPSPHEDILINVEAFRGAIRKGNWKLVKIALLPGKTELFDLSKDPGEKNNVADQFPEIVRDLEDRLIAYAKEMKPSEWIKAQPAFLGAQGKTVFDPEFDIDDSGLPHEKVALPQD